MKRHEKIIAAFIFLTSLVLAQPIAARELHSLKELEKRVEGFLVAGIGEPGGARAALDRRLKIEKCPGTIDFEKRRPNLLYVRCEALGWRISVPLLAVHSSSLTYRESRYSIARGQPVLLVAGHSGFSISRQMVAVRSGKHGDFIPVRANRRSQPIMAKIIGPGRVSVIDVGQR